MDQAQIEWLLEQEYAVIDFLPEQVPADSSGQFFAVERFFLQEPEHSALRRKFLRILLKLSCYAAVSAYNLTLEQEAEPPSPDLLADWMLSGSSDILLLIPEEQTLLSARRDETNLTVYHPSARIRTLAARLAAAEGLFLWTPPSQPQPCPAPKSD